MIDWVATTIEFANQSPSRGWQLNSPRVCPLDAACEIDWGNLGRSPRLLTVCSYRRYPIRLGSNPTQSGLARDRIEPAQPRPG